MAIFEIDRDGPAVLKLKAADLHMGAIDRFDGDGQVFGEGLEPQIATRRDLAAIDRGAPLATADRLDRVAFGP